MGWTFGYRSRAAALREAFEGVTVLRSTPGRGCQWLICRNDRTAERFICVALLENHGTDWGIKVLDETCGPSACDCPSAWLEEVPEPGGYAAKFRQRVREYWSSRQEPERAPVTTIQQELTL